MEMTPEIAAQILDKNLSTICPNLLVPQYVRNALLDIGLSQDKDKGFRRMIDYIRVSSHRSVQDGQTILFLYPLCQNVNNL